MNVYDAIITRRSTRIYKDEPLDEKLIETIVEAGRMAPSGGNSQKNHFFVITNKEFLEKIAGVAKDAVSKMEVYEGMYKSMASAITRAR